jgi:excisionase family DNA binding protein
VSVKSVYRLARRGRLTSLRIGGLLRFTEDDLGAYLEQARRKDNGGGR